ncbi:rhamnulokinase family protein [Arthrobacter sp. MYb213]|uniref:rhamnulokinase n=1 Tax=Arthrobacter sp. MYb213 TaxID=1848595 RepID=UPI000CFCF7D2|nr:rhamnulokinase family protein [Arthrobacter sp. MYb213]PRB70217.1 rhamnulokinase [Arthrobacter sp. MYb213]
MNKITSNAPVVAVDLGATSGRVMLGELVEGKIEISPVHRFSNGAVPLSALESGAKQEALAWDIERLWKEILYGLKLAFKQRPDISSIGVDSWAVDYALLREGKRLGEVRHYRDPRNEVAVPALEAIFGREELYSRNGLQFLPFNTIYQLQAELAEERLSDADMLLLVPDYFNWLLTGVARSEWTNVSTTGLLDLNDGLWNPELTAHLQVNEILAPIIQPGEVVGSLRQSLREELGADAEVKVLAVASHDTASAVAATPLSSSTSAYVSCGTWGLVGVELQAPVLESRAQKAGFTNELGVDGTVRFLKNITGTFLLSESIRHWNEQTQDIEENEANLADLLAESEQLELPKVLIDPQSVKFLSPGNMPERISDAVHEAGGHRPQSRAELIRIVIESLAASFARRAMAAAELAGFELDVIHMVGGGSQGRLLCQRTADQAGVPVIAGPVECTALGNVLVQLRAAEFTQWTLAESREVVRNSVLWTQYEPQNVRELV